MSRVAGRLPILSPRSRFGLFTRPVQVLQTQTVWMRKPSASSESQGRFWPIWEETTDQQKNGGRRIAIASSVLVVSALASKACSMYEPRDLIPEKEQSLVNRTFVYVGAGLALTAIYTREFLKGEVMSRYPRDTLYAIRTQKSANANKHVEQGLLWVMIFS